MQLHRHIISERSAEVGVLQKYLDCEVDLVNDALSRSVPAVEQFEVLDSVVGSNAVDVVYGFLGKQVAPEVPGHDVAVFHDMSLSIRSASKFRHIKPNVSMAFGVFFVAAGFKFVQGFFTLSINFAIVVAILLLLVQATSRFTAFGMFFTARQARESVSGFARLATSHARALSRAVPRVASIFFMVCGDEVLHHREVLATFAASEVHGHSSVTGRDSLGEAVRTSAGETAILSVFARETGKWLLAVFTDFLNRHGMAPLFGDEGTLLRPIGNVK
jgi:hypothetical protein